MNHFSRSASAFQLTILLTCFFSFTTGITNTACGQTAPAKSTVDADDEQAGPEEVTLETKDKVQLVCTYFPPSTPSETADEKETPDSEKTTAEESADGKKVIPYIVLHDWESSRENTEALATFLSSQGNAVIIPDLRGHGASTQVVGYDKAIDVQDFKSAEINAVLEDIETCKRFLVKKNNAGELNVDMLAVIAIGKTAPLATAWVVKDWSFAPYRKGIKQGQDVKTLIMISPEKKLGAFAINRVISAPIFSGPTALPTIVAWGAQSETSKETQSIYNRLEKKRPEVKDKSAGTKTLYQAPLRNSSLTGVEIGSDPKFKKLWGYFHKTVSGKINDNLDKLPWQDRSEKK